MWKLSIYYCIHNHRIWTEGFAAGEVDNTLTLLISYCIAVSGIGEYYIYLSVLCCLLWVLWTLVNVYTYKISKQNTNICCKHLSMSSSTKHSFFIYVRTCIYYLFNWDVDNKANKESPALWLLRNMYLLVSDSKVADVMAI